jgi:hypothetical protein
MRIIETKVYTINEHPNKENCFEWIRENWHDLNQHSIDEVVNSIKELSNKIGGSFDYSISQISDRNEFITFKDYSKKKLLNLIGDDCPLTGFCWDIDLINGLKSEKLSKVLDSLHLDAEYLYSNEGLLELCEANDYEFDEEGNCI